MRAIILAGGKGTRLQSVVKDVPKPMANVAMRPFLEYLLDQLIAQGIKHFYLSIGYLGEVIKNHFKDQYRSASIEYINEERPLGTGGALINCFKKLNQLDEDIWVFNGDTYLQLDLAKMKKFHHAWSADCSIALRRVPTNDRYSGVTLDSDQRITQFCERSANSTQTLINAGAYLMSSKMMKQKLVIQDQPTSLEDEIFPNWVKTNQVYGFITEGKFIDIGIPQDYRKSQTFFRNEAKIDSKS